MQPCALLRSLAVFLLWTLASFLCHHLAKMALQRTVTDASTLAVMPFIVTVFQTLCCLVCVKTSLLNRSVSLIAASHCLATLATNTSMALTFASSTLAIKMLEPVTSAVLQQLIFRTALKVESLVGMVVVVVGAVVYVGNPAENEAVARAVVMAVISNLALGVRNVAIKNAQQQQLWEMTFRSARCIALFLSLPILVLLCALYSSRAGGAAAVMSQDAIHFTALSLMSGAFHVTYSYLSTCLVLRHMSVLGHALANIMKRVLVVCLLHVKGGRSASWVNWAGLGLCTAGLLLYNRGKKASYPQWDSHGSAPGQGPAQFSGRLGDVSGIRASLLSKDQRNSVVGWGMSVGSGHHYCPRTSAIQF